MCLAKIINPFGIAKYFRTLYEKQWVTSQPPIAHFNLNLNYEKFICLFTVQKCTLFFSYASVLSKKTTQNCRFNTVQAFFIKKNILFYISIFSFVLVWIKFTADIIEPKEIPREFELEKFEW